MAHEHLNNSTLARSLSDVIGDLSDLLQKEMRLAQAEISAKLSSKLKASVWIGAAGLLWLLAGLLVVQGLVFGIASFGLALHSRCTGRVSWSPPCSEHVEQWRTSAVEQRCKKS
jgi:Putative Actinobacterial Holin-X, holin superfamily III